jgi:hypothetical protein
MANLFTYGEEGILIDTKPIVIDTKPIVIERKLKR